MTRKITTLIIVGVFLVLVLSLQGCATPVAIDTKVVRVPTVVPCEVVWPEKPRAYVDEVEETGETMKDALALVRAAIAEIEERIAYEIKLEAALRACAKEIEEK